MALTPWCCANCGFWQRRFARPTTCPSCEDFRHPLPSDGYVFLTPDEVAARHKLTWHEALPDVWQFRLAPDLAIGQTGFLIRTPDGNVHLEGCGWYDDAALDFIAAQGGVAWLSASHHHVYGALWRVAERFAPTTVIHDGDLSFAQAFPVTYPADDAGERLGALRLVHTGGHTPGHCVFHWPARRTLFCGDAFKFTLNPDGTPANVATHKAFDAHVPLTRADLRRYLDAIEPLDFDAVATPWEVVARGGKAACVDVLRRQLATRPFCDFTPAVARDSLGAVTDAYKRIVPPGRAFELDLTPLDVTGVPVWNASVWTDATWENGIGYGPTAAAAKLSAWAELAEFNATCVACRDLPRVRASYAELRARGEGAIDPLTLRLPVGTDYTERRELLWLRGARHGTGAPVWVPVEAVASSFEDLPPDAPVPLFTPISNGSGAGDTLERALAHALLELAQRDGNSAGYRALDRGVRLDLDDVRDAATRALLARLDAAGIDVLAKLADVTLGMASVYVVGRERDAARCPFPLMLSGCGEAAHPDRGVALRKALFEFCASRARKRFVHGPLAPLDGVCPPEYLALARARPPTVEESRSFAAISEWAELPASEVLRRLEDSVFRVERTVPFSSLPTTPAEEPATLLKTVAARYALDGLDVVYVDLLPPSAPVRCVRAVVGAMEVETVTYGRVGPRNLRRLLARGCPWVGLGTGGPRVPLTAADERALGGPAWFDFAACARDVEPLYALYREPEAHAVAVAREREATR